jgi:hypothetical protein
MRRATFPSTRTSVASARDLVGQACVEWGFTCPGGKVVWATMSAATPPSTVAR